MSKELQIQLATKLKHHYKCEVIINENEEPFCLFRLSDVGKMMQLSCVRSVARNYDKVYVKCNTNGGIQTETFISYDTLREMLTKSRRPSVVEICNTLDIDVFSKTYMCIEADTIKCILESFRGEQMNLQHRIGQYMVDLYFPEYNIIVECDEAHHANDIKKDEARELHIKEICKGCVFIRYSPQSLDFNMFQLINRIYTAIKQ